MSRRSKVTALALLVVALVILACLALLMRVPRQKEYSLLLQKVSKAVGVYKCEFVFTNKANTPKYLLGGEQPFLGFYIKQGGEWIHGYSAEGIKSNHGKVMVLSGAECRFSVLMPQDISTCAFYAEVVLYDGITNQEGQVITSPQYRFPEGTDYEKDSWCKPNSSHP